MTVLDFGKKWMPDTHDERTEFLGDLAELMLGAFEQLTGEDLTMLKLEAGQFIQEKMSRGAR